MLASFVDLFRTHREEAADTIWELVRRVIDGETIPAAVLVKAATEAGMAAGDVDAMARRMRHRDELRRVAAGIDGADAEMAKLTEAIGKHDASLEDAQRRHAQAVEPLREQLAEAQARYAEARQADANLLSPEWMEPHLLAELREAENEYHTASEALVALEREHHEQARRASDAEHQLVSGGQDPRKLEKLWRDESTRHLIGNSDERMFLNWLRGNRRAGEAAERLPAARQALESAKQRVSEIHTEARAS